MWGAKCRQLISKLSYCNNVWIPRKRSIAPSTIQTQAAFPEKTVHLPCSDACLNLLKKKSENTFLNLTMVALLNGTDFSKHFKHHIAEGN